MKKHIYVRDGVEREFTQEQVDLYSTPTQKFPESQGWIKKPEEIGGIKPAVVIPPNVKKVEDKTATTDLDQDSEAKVDIDAKASATTEISHEGKSESATKKVETISQDYTTGSEQLATIRELLAGQTADVINEFFDGDIRVTMIKIKEELLSEK